jgi:hypothetical protein
MAPLPDFRTPGSKVNPFDVTAVDVGGPYITKQGRGKVIAKRYLLVFRCAAIGAVHCELLKGLDTTSFLQALDKFLA